MIDNDRIERALRAGPPDEPLYAAAFAPLAHAKPPAFPRAQALTRVPSRRLAAPSFGFALAAVVSLTLVAALVVVRNAQPVSSPSGSGSPAPSVTASPSPREISGAELDALLGSWASDLGAGGDTPGVSAAITVDGRIWLSGYTVHPDTKVLRIGPASRTYLIAVVLQLADEGRLSLGDPISRYVPNWPSGDRISIRMLMAGSSGAAPFGQPVEALAGHLAADPKHDWTSADALTIARNGQPRFDPGGGFEPVDTDDALLVNVIEAVTHSPASAEIRRRLLDPLALKATYVAGEPIPPPGSGKPSGAEPGSPEMSRGHWDPTGTGRREAIDDLPADVLAVLGSARGMAATVADLGRWSDALHQGPIVLSHDSRALLDRPYGVDGFGGAGMCPCLGDVKRALVVSGSVGAYASLVAWFPSERISVAVLVDRTVAPSDLGRLLERVYALAGP